MWESDATARAALEQAYTTNITPDSSSSALTGGRINLEALTLGDGASYGANLAGSYARLWQSSPLDDAEDPPPADNVSGEVGLRGSWVTSALTNFSLDSRGYMASRLGVRATDPLAERDPFAGDRVQYTFGGGGRYSQILTRRWSWALGGGYDQAGAVMADQAEAVGVDTHTGRGDVSLTHELSDQDYLTPGVRYSYTHFYHALLDAYLTRGPADVHAGTGYVTETHHFSRQLNSQVTGGVTVANPPAILDSQDLVVSPDVGLSLNYLGKQYKAIGAYTYAYTSLGPRIGFGHEHEGRVEVGMRPKNGARFRDFWVTGVARFAYGSAPVAANPLTVTGELAPVSTEGVISTYTGVLGVLVEYPLFRGLAAVGGLDFEYVRADIDAPPPPAGFAPYPQSDPSLRTIAMVGIAGTFSTDKRNTVRKDPDDMEDERPRSRRDHQDGERTLEKPTTLAIRGTPQTTFDTATIDELKQKGIIDPKTGEAPKTLAGQKPGAKPAKPGAKPPPKQSTEGAAAAGTTDADKPADPKEPAAPGAPTPPAAAPSAPAQPAPPATAAPAPPPPAPSGGGGGPAAPSEADPDPYD